MLLKDYLNKTTHDRRILIVSDLVRGQALIRMYEEKTGDKIKVAIVMPFMTCAAELFARALLMP